MSFRVVEWKFEGKRAVIANLNKMSDELKSRLRTAVKVSAHRIKADAKRRVPVSEINHEHLRDTIGVKTYGYTDKRQSIVALIGTNVEYARYVEFGTKKRKAKPYMYPAANAEVPKFQRNIEVEIEKAARRFNG